MKNFHKFLTDLGLDPNNFTAYKFFIASITFFMPIFWTAMGIFGLMVLDFITAIIAARKNKVPITSRAMSKSVYKAVVYQLMLISGFLSDRLLDTDIIVKSITYFLVTLEMVSVSENVQKITGIPIVKYIKDLIESKIKPALKIEEGKEKEPEV